MMNSKERVRLALNHQKPDQIPVFADFVPEVKQKLMERYYPEEDIGIFLGNDMIARAVGIDTSYYASEEPEYTDKWGITWENVWNSSGHYTEIIKSPLAGDTGKLDKYECPDPDETTQYDGLREVIGRYGKDKWIVGSSLCSIFEAAWYLRGFDQFLMDMAVDEGYTNALMDKMLAYVEKVCLNMVGLGVDMIFVGDDVAMQSGMLMSMDMWRKYLKPRYAYLFGRIKQANPKIKTAYHSCGDCRPIWDEMIEIGLDVINPIQPSCMDPVDMKKQYGKRISLYGGFDIQKILPLGTPGEIEAEVKRLIMGCGGEGGFILAPAHHIQADTSVENVQAFYTAAKKYAAL